MTAILPKSFFQRSIFVSALSTALHWGFVACAVGGAVVPVHSLLSQDVTRKISGKRMTRGV